MTMAMASASEANSARQITINLNFFERHQTINLTITPTLGAGNNSAPDSFNITRLHKIYAFIVSIFVGLLQIQSQGNTISLFRVHPVTSTTSVLCILGYCLAFIALLCLPIYATKLRIAMGVFGSLSVASLVTLLNPDSWWWYIIRYIFYVLLIALVLLHNQLLKVLYGKYLRRFTLTTRSSWPPYPARRLLPLSYMDVR